MSIMGNDMLSFLKGANDTRVNVVNILERLEVHDNWKVVDPLTEETIFKYKNGKDFKDNIFKDLATHLNIKI